MSRNPAGINSLPILKRQHKQLELLVRSPATEPLARSDNPMSQPEHVDPKQLRPGPIRHGSLPPEMLERIKAVYDLVGQYLNTTLEQFEIGFMRDMHPEDEVALWCSITAAWLAYHKEFLNNEALPDEEEKKLLAALIAISAGVEDVSKLGVPAEVGRKLLECYDGLSNA